MIWAIDHGDVTPLREQIVTCVRRGITSGDLDVGALLPPAVELGEALSVDRNTVLAAYRQLRDDGVLEFRRGRGVRVARTTVPQDAVVTAANALLSIARSHGIEREGVIQLIRELS
jgi:DNA-binding transcriptional regulator YhcF (GntR family)